MTLLLNIDKYSDQAHNDIWSRVLGGRKERREQITCSGNEDATIDNGQQQKGPCQKTGNTRGC